MSRREQFLNVQNSVSDMVREGEDIQNISFGQLRAVLENGRFVMRGASPERYTAMFKSLVMQNTMAEDVIWHKY